jgi:simple sugar transport system permease protein
VTDTSSATERSAEAAAPKPARRSTGVAVARLRDLSLLPGIAIILIVGTLVSPHFLTRGNLLDQLSNIAYLSMLVLAEAVILISGKLDLSLESTLALGPAVALWLTLPKSGRGIALLPSGWAIPITLAVGALVGVVNAILILRFKLSSFIVTLGMLITVRGLENGISNSQTYFGVSKSFLYLNSAQWFGIPIGDWLALLAFAVGILVLTFTRAGRSIYAIGGNSDAARAAGIRVERTLLFVFVIGSALAALGGVLYTAKYASMSANTGSGKIFTVFAAVVIGGISLNGGKGTLFGAFCGIFLLDLIQNVLTFAGVKGTWLDFFDGVIILSMLILSRLTTGEAQD